MISITESNGDIGYIPPDVERPNGDYECCCCILDEGAESDLADAGKKLVLTL